MLPRRCKMPSWKFLIARHYAGSLQRKIVCATIRTNVEQHGLASVLPLVKFETGKSKEYYLGIAFDENIPNAVEDARRVLLESSIKNIILEPQQPEAIKSLLRGTIDCASFTIPISYEKENEPETINPSQILSLADTIEMQSFEKNMPEIEFLDKLLYWCSSTGQGDLRGIQNACELLGICTEWGGTWSVLRRFVLLGHLEFKTLNTIRWGVVPSVLIKTSENGAYFLSGQRSPSMMTALQKQLDVKENPQMEGPKQLIVEGVKEDVDIILTTSQKIVNLGCVSERLSKLLPKLELWAKSIPAWDEKDFERYQIELYFPQNDEFVTVESMSQPEKGLYRFSIEHNKRKLETLAYFDDKNIIWKCGDFYGLRFLARQNVGICNAVYNEKNNELVIADKNRWPMPYERALVLASGMLPRRLKTENGLSVLAYAGVSRELAKRLCGLLSLTMEG